MSTRKKDIGILKTSSARYVAKKWIDEVAKLKVLNETSLESKQFHVIPCPMINLN